MLDLLAWTATASILLTYALSVRKPFLWGPRFHLANALGCLPLAWLNYKAGVLPALAVNLGFGIPAWYAVSGRLRDWWAARPGKRRDSGPREMYREFPFTDDCRAYDNFNYDRLQREAYEQRATGTGH